MNPIKSWDGLSRNGKIAVVAGVLAISIFWFYHNKQKQAVAAAAATTSDASGTSDTSGDTGDTSDSYNGYDDSSTDPSNAYTQGYDDAISAYGDESSIDAGLGGYGLGDISDVGYPNTNTGAGSTTSTSPSTTTQPPVNVTVNTPASSTGGGAPNTPPASAHQVTQMSTGKLLSAGAILAPFGTRTTKSGYVTVGTGGGNYEYIPVHAAPSGYTIYHSVSATKPQANAKGLGGGLWAIPV